MTRGFRFLKRHMGINLIQSRDNFGVHGAYFSVRRYPIVSLLQCSNGANYTTGKHELRT